ncbi:Uncharacterised protein [uncultured archaeon]|nr:Uncharacterised protein [uncultured archaeon]
MSKTRLSLVSGSCRVPLGSIDVTKKGDIYLAPFPFSKSGIHMSFHRSGKMHIRNKFGFDEPINLNISDANEIENWLRKNTYNPDHGEDVLLLSGSYGNYQQHVSNKNDLCVSLNNITNDFCLHQVPVEILPKYFKYFQASPLETHVIIDETNNSIAFYDKHLGIWLELSMEFSTIEKQFETMPFIKNLWQPLNKAFQIERECIINQGEIPNYQFFPKEFEFPKLKINKFF